MPEYNIVESYELKREIYIKRRNRNLKSKGIFNYIPFLLENLGVLGVETNADNIEWIEIHDSLRDLSDDNILKIFTSFSHSNFSKENLSEEIFLENMVSFIIYSYYYTATHKPYLMNLVNRLTNYNLIIHKVLSYHTSETQGYEDNFISRINKYAIAAREEGFNYLIEDYLIEDTYLFEYIESEEEIKEEEFISKLEHEADRFVEWAYNLWKNTRFFYGNDTDTVEKQYDNVINHITFSFFSTIEYFYNITERGWYAIDIIKNHLGDTDDNLGLKSRVDDLRRKDGI